MNNETINIFVSGDFAPTIRVNEVISKGDYHLLYNDILPIIKEADIAITNLESPLIDGGKPIAKTGPNLKAPVKSIDAVKFAGFDMVTLANNHMMDYGDEGLLSTMQTCDNAGIRHIGAGSNLEEAKKIEYFNVKDNCIAFINCCENEWSTTQGDYPGCNPLGEVALFYQIQEAKSNSDYIVLIIHGGHETYDYPSIRMKKLYRWFIDLGVDAVVGHHTHCFSGYEIYKGKPVIYSLGNFIFDSSKRKSLWNVGAAVVLSMSETGISMRLLPFTQCDDVVGVKLFGKDEKEAWLKQEAQKSEQIQDDTILERKFEKFASKLSNQYRGFLEPNTSSLILYAKNRGLLPRKIKGKKRLLVWDIIRAEAHRDILLTILSKEK